MQLIHAKNKINYRFGSKNNVFLLKFVKKQDILRSFTAKVVKIFLIKEVKV